MSHDLLIRPIAHIRTDFPSKFGIPRQAGLAEALEVLSSLSRSSGSTRHSGA